MIKTQKLVWERTKGMGVSEPEVKFWKFLKKDFNRQWKIHFWGFQIKIKNPNPSEENQKICWYRKWRSEIGERNPEKDQTFYDGE